VEDHQRPLGNALNRDRRARLARWPAVYPSCNVRVATRAPRCARRPPGAWTATRITMRSTPTGRVDGHAHHDALDAHRARGRPRTASRADVRAAGCRRRRRGCARRARASCGCAAQRARLLRRARHGAGHVVSLSRHAAPYRWPRCRELDGRAGLGEPNATVLGELLGLGPERIGNCTPLACSSTGRRRQLRIGVAGAGCDYSIFGGGRSACANTVPTNPFRPMA
jgi:hypothetical protein